MKRHLLLCLILFLCVPVFSQGRHQLRRNGRVLAYGLNFNPEQPEEQMPEALREMLRGYNEVTERLKPVATSGIESKESENTAPDNAARIMTALIPSVS